MDQLYLYRGFNCQTSLEQAFTSKAPSVPLETGAECGDERVQCGDPDFSCGLSVANTIRSHEYNGNGESTCGLSTSPKFDVAAIYALGKKDDLFEYGTVATISVQVLLANGVQIVRVNDVLENPSKPEDDEYWLWSSGDFPLEAIVKQVRVES